MYSNSTDFTEGLVNHIFVKFKLLLSDDLTVPYF